MIRLDRSLVLTGAVAERQRVVARALGHSAGTARSAGLHQVASVAAHQAGDPEAAWRHALELESLAATERDRAEADSFTRPNGEGSVTGPTGCGSMEAATGTGS